MRSGGIELLNIDCMEYMSTVPDKFFDLAIVDPPYGLGLDGGQLGYSKHVKKDWDTEHPKEEYFNELFRVSKNQIIWGFNHFMHLLKPTKAVIFWNKHQNGYFAEGELAWCSIGTVKYFDRAYQKDIGGKIHPTQKPVELLKTLISIFTDEGDVVIDPCAGSGSTIIAAERLNRKGYGFEIKKEFWTKANKWLEEEKQIKKDMAEFGFNKTQLEKINPTLFS